MKSPAWLLTTPLALIAALYLSAGVFWPVVGVAVVVGWAVTGVRLFEWKGRAEVAEAAVDDLDHEADLLAATVREAALDIAALEAENMHLHLKLTEAELLAGTKSIPHLRSVSDSWLEQIMDEQERTWNERHGSDAS